MIRIYKTERDWQFGLGIGFPTQSENYFLGSKMFHGWMVSLFFGPWTLEIGRKPVELLEDDE